MPMYGPGTENRIQTMELRIRLEQLGVDAFHHVCKPAKSGSHTRTQSRLLLILAGSSTEDWQSTYHAIHLGMYIYRRTSDVLHGRIEGLNIPQVVLDEWQAAVDGLEKIARQQGA